MEKLNSKWFLVYTKSREEEIAKENLQNQGYETFLPMIAQEQDNKLASFMFKPLFPRYIFIAINLESDNWTQIKSTRGVSHIVVFGKTMASVPNSVIRFLRRRVDDNGILIQKITRKKFQKGDKIIIKKGPLKGQEATFLSKTGKERVRILLKLMNELIIAEVPRQDVDTSKAILETLKL